MEIREVIKEVPVDRPVEVTKEIVRNEYIEVPVSNSADTRAWQIAKRRVLDMNPNKSMRAVELFRLVEEVKDLALSGDPQGNMS